MTLKHTLANRPDYLPKDDNSYLDFTMKALEWFEGFEKELRLLIKHYENANPQLEESILWHIRVADALKQILGEKRGEE